MRDEVLVLAAEDRPLSGPEPPELDPEDRAEEERQERDRRRPPSPRSRRCWSDCALPTGYGHASHHWNVTGNVSELFAVFFSPGTGTISAVTLWEPFGGDALSVTWQLVDSPAVVCGTIVCPLTLVPDTVTRHFTLVSVFWPVLAKSSVNVGAGLAGIELVDPV